MCKKIVLVLGFVLLISSVVNAEMLVRDYKRFVNDPLTREEMIGYVGAMGWGIFYHDAVLIQENRFRLFCLPKNFIPNQAAFVRQALKLEIPTVVAALRLPYDLIAFPEGRNLGAKGGFSSSRRPSHGTGRDGRL